MKISYNWLKEYLPELDLPVEKAARLLTMSGLEVESVEEVESVKGGLKGVVVGEVLTKAQHPNADRLSVTTVNTGSQVLNIVCGASNVAAGQKVLVATVGSVLHTTSGDVIEIKKSKIRGEASEGMICAEDELGLGDSHEGIMVLDSSTPVGMEAASYFNLQSDHVLEIGLTPNRSDAMSHYGVARDLRAVMLAEGMKDPGIAKGESVSLQSGSSDLANVENSEGAPRYSVLHLSDVNVSDSPDWLKQRLTAVGIKSINNVVDITNYVMLETGQPLHAFDLDRIKGGKVRVMNVSDGTLFKTLDGVERKLSSKDLMICDAEGTPLTIAGVYGGLDSGITSDTKHVLLESAWFNSVMIRKTSKRHGLKTDASFRFERGTDPDATVSALQRAAYLLKELAGAGIASSVNDVYPEKAMPFSVKLNISRVNILTGVEIPVEKIRSILASLEISIDHEEDGVMDLSVPRFKTDVQREADVIEEILRIYGYNNVPVPTKLNASLQFSKGADKEKIMHTIADVLTGMGYSEALNNSLTKSAYEQFVDATPVTLMNPLSSELQNMRTSMLFTLLENIEYNMNRRSGDVRLFEFGKVYTQANGKFKEYEKLALVLSGNTAPESWLAPSSKSTFFDLKGVVTSLMSKLNISGVVENVVESAMYSDALELAVNKKTVAIISQVKEDLLKKVVIDQPVFYAEFDLDYLIRKHAESKVVFRELPKFPSVRRDLALLIDEQVSYDSLRNAAFDTDKKLLKEVNLFDVYRGKNLDPGKKSYALSFIMQDESATLNDKQIDKVMQNLQRIYTEKFGAKIR